MDPSGNDFGLFWDVPGSNLNGALGTMMEIFYGCFRIQPSQVL
jgi:hypothetical protein